VSAEECYVQCDAVLGVFLAGEGFAGSDGEYRREQPDGTDRVLVDADDRKKKFSVLLAYYPHALAILDDFIEGEDRGFPCGPFLTPVAVTRRKHSWSYQPKKKFDQSLREVQLALETVGLPWLARLRDPNAYVAEIDPDALFDQGLANEWVGDQARARTAYLQLFERFQEMLSFASEELVMKEVGKQFIFVAAKLGREEERVRRFREHHKYWRPVPPLGEGFNTQ